MSATTGEVRLDTEVTDVGGLAAEFFAGGIIVLFGDDAPEELQEVAVVHHAEVNVGGVSAGDTVTLTRDDETTATMRVLAVGDVANQNLVNLGHLVLKRNGSTDAALPGDVCCDEGPIPTITAGDRLVVSADTEQGDG
jgi:PTS system glucitol/sorbitol-specific IIA component